MSDRPEDNQPEEGTQEAEQASQPPATPTAEESESTEGDPAEAQPPQAEGSAAEIPQAGPSSPPAAEAQPSSPPAAEAQPSSPPAAEAQPSSPPAAEAQPSSPPAAEAQPSSPPSVEEEPKKNDAPSGTEASAAESKKEEPPPSSESSGSVANPIRAMRVIRLEETKRSGSAPAIETSSASYEELEDELSDEQLSHLAPSPAPQSVEPIPESGAEPAEVVEELEAVEEVPRAPSVPAPPKRESQPSIPAADRKPPPPRRSARPSLPKAKSPRKKPWWETLFGDDFSRAYRPMSQSQLSKEVDFILESLDVPKGAVILDLGCGQGEICVELARRGYSVVGYDLSVYQLAMAGDHAQQAKQKINFLQGDMREMAFDEMFDAVICWDTSFGYFEDEKNVDVLHRVKKALKPNGRFLLDVMNRDFAAREAPYNHWFEGDGCVCMDDMSLDWITNRLRVKRSIILDDGRSKELQYSTRLYTLSEVGRLLHDAGFRVSAVSGDVVTKGAFFGPHSRRIIIQSGKP